MKLKDLNETQRRALMKYRKSKELSAEEQKFIREKYPDIVTAEDIITEATIVEAVDNLIDGTYAMTPTEVINHLNTLIDRIKNGDLIDIPAGTAVEKAPAGGFSSSVWIYYINGEEFYDYDIREGMLKEL